ncbi:hypothetical protein OF83DRAFT_174495 [Amylostereum chailletii]|nr:hypothetical protein OF83DRAFT_174495 [Amylostereum chailletii]
MPGEAHGDYVVRYLKTIVAWIEAFVWAATSRNLSVALRPYELVLPLHPFRVEDEEQFEQLKQRVLGLVRGVSVTLNPRDIRNAPVHAEAGLMGVACASWNAEGIHDSPSLPIEDENTKRALRNMFLVQEIPVGVSKLCCWCCWKLRTLLGELNGKDAAVCPPFILSGTHATVFPWYPPPCGIPRSVLKSMEDELILEVEKLAKRRTFDNASHQSSPSSADSEPDEDRHPIEGSLVDEVMKEFDDDNALDRCI